MAKAKGSGGKACEGRVVRVAYGWGRTLPLDEKPFEGGAPGCPVFKGETKRRLFELLQ